MISAGSPVLYPIEHKDNGFGIPCCLHVALSWVIRVEAIQAIIMKAS